MLALLLALGCSDAVDVPLPSDTDTDTVDVGVERTYAGGWPTRADRDALPAGSWDDRPRVGEPVPRFSGVDQFGEQVHLFDFYGEAPVIIDLSTGWCGICREVAQWLSTGGDPDLEAEWGTVRARVNDGSLRWITVLSEDDDARPATAATVTSWHGAHPHPHIPVLADGRGQLADWAHAYGFPTLLLLHEDLTLELLGDGYGDVLDTIGEPR